jgi:Leucine-rich repeat (LRR) protein
MHDQQNFPLEVAQGLTNLTSLYAPFCHDITVEHFKLMPRLTYLVISGVNINTSFLQYTPMLTSLDICENHCALGADLQHVPKLRYLNVSDTLISAPFIRMYLPLLNTLIINNEFVDEDDLAGIPLIHLDATASKRLIDIVSARRQQRKK